MIVNFVETIGQGGFGIVDRVVDDNGLSYARKTFQLNQGPNFPKHLEESVKKRFKREAKYQAEIRHKNIVPVIYSNLAVDPPFFIMPLAISTLQKDIESESSLNGRYLAALLDIIAGLEVLHGLDIFHRDLKPANVLRFKGEDGSPDYYAIGDFGLMSIAKVTTVSSITQTGMKMGSDYYTAPEIIKELKNASVRSDIYSLGCILHDFVGREDRVPNVEIKEEGDFSAILLNCTRSDPNRRFKSVVAVRDAMLSLGNITIVPKTTEGARIFEILQKPITEFSEENWREIIFFIEDRDGSPDAVGLLRSLSIDHIDRVLSNHQQLGSSLGKIYADWIRERSFDFNECDGLSIRLQRFVESCTISVKVECLMAMLYMGTRHNRWYVEDKFATNVGRDLDDKVAARLAIEIRVDEDKACKAFNHLSFSIKFKLEKLHHIIYSTIQEVCKAQ